VFRRLDPDFAARAEKSGGGFIVAGNNYGQGSSREHAALAPKYLGIKAVIEKSFARIHRRNLIAQGILPLTFVDPGDYERLPSGSRLELPDVRDAIRGGEPTWRLVVSARDAEMRLGAPFSPREREVLLDGGLFAHLRVADPAYNVERTLGLAHRASDLSAVVALFPELGISAYSNEDLHQQDALQEGVQRALARLVEESGDLLPVLPVGAPLRFEAKLFNCALVIHRGRVLGIVPKSYLPNYREFYEARQFAPARAALGREVRFLGDVVPFGNDLLFEATNLPDFELSIPEGQLELRRAVERFPTCPAKRAASTRAASRPTTSKSRASRSGWPARGSRRW
jgi:predicted amidohydrolase